MPQQGSLGEDIEDNNTTTKSAIEEAGNTDSSTESEQDVTVSDIEATTEGIVGENILEYDELTQEGECCPTQYECNVSTTTDEPVTTVVVTISEGSVTTKQPSTDSSVVTSEASQTEISSDNETQTDSATELVDSDESGFGSTTFDGSDVQEITTESGTFPESSSVESVTSLLTGFEENESTSEDESNPTTLSNAEEVTTAQTIVETEKQETATDSESGETTTETASEQTEDNVTESITDTVEDLSIETVTEVDAITESEEGSVNTEASAETVTER